VLEPGHSAGPPAQGAYAQRVRQTLLASNDVELLARTVEQLQADRPNRQFARSLVDRALKIKPGVWTAHMQQDWLKQLAVQWRTN